MESVVRQKARHSSENIVYTPPEIRQGDSGTRQVTKLDITKPINVY